MKGYGQYCPISRSAELLGDRWTLHIVRDLMTGTSRFNELVRGNPGLSRALHSRRLDQLVRAGVIAHNDDGAYVLTDAGKDLEPIVFGLATWGAKWAFGEPEPEELNPDILMWWLHRRIDPSQLPGRRFVVHVLFRDHKKRYWIVVENEASICLSDPGFDIDVTIRTDRWSLYRAYMGHDTLAGACRAGDVEMTGNRAAIRAFMAAFRQSPVGEIVAAAG